MGFTDSFQAFQVIFVLVVLLIAVTTVVIVVQGIRTWNKNNHSPRLSVDATVESKRVSVHQTNQPVGGDPTGAHGFMTESSRTYYVTFQVESGDTMEFSVSGTEYDEMTEGETGKLSFQGSRFLAFDKAQ